MFSTSPPPRLRLQLLGEMQVTLDGAPLTGKVYGKLLALLAFLALEDGRSHPREHLAELFWPTLAPDAARTNLRQSLYNLRRTLGDSTTDFLVSGRESVRIGAPGLISLDVREFAALPTCPSPPAPDQCKQCLARLEHGAALWRGEFLAGLVIEEAPGFEEWRAGWRESLHRQMLALLERLRLCHERQGAFDRALLHAQHYAVIDPWDETGHREVMRLLALNGQRSAALAQYEACRAMLERELGMAPETATQLLFERIRDGLLVAERPAAAITTPIAAERRQVTVLHCCLTVPGESDAEEIADRLRAPYQRCAEIVRHFGAHVAASPGGTLVAYFGYPAAFEDAARRAVRSALALSEAGGAPGVILRTGIHTDTIVTDNHPDRPDSAGVASKVALRLSDRAGPGEVVLSDATRRLVVGYFHLHTIGPQSLAESLQPIPTFRASGETGASSRLDASPLLPMVGRSAELERLTALAAETRHGSGHRVVLRGEAGMGKSRLLRALRTSLGDMPWSIRELHCLPEHRHTPLHPVIAMIERLFAYGPDDAPAAKRDMMSAYLAAWHGQLHDKASPLLEALLGIGAEPSPLPPEQLKQATLAVLLELLDDAAAQQPLLLAVEDLHWADPATLELLSFAAQYGGDRPVLSVYTARTEYPLPAWLSDRALVLELPHLDDASMTALVLEAEAGLTPETVGRIVERADGVPLFAEELAHLAAEPEAGAADIPSTLSYLLATRLDAVEEARRIAQIAATVGRGFDLDLLGRAANLDADSLAQDLRLLQEARLVAALGDSRFQFRHALIQEAAYKSQTKAARQGAHRCVADALIRHFPQRAAHEPAEVARHLTEAGAAAEAIPWRLAVGQRALGAGAYTEAAEHLRAGLAAVGMLPNEARDRAELDLLLPLGHTLLALAGYGSAEAAAVFDRAYALCGEDENDSRRLEILWGQWMVSSSRPDAGFDVSAALVDEMLPLARKIGEGKWLAHAYASAANVALWQGRIHEACRHGEAAIEAAQATFGEHPIDAHDPEVAGWSYLSWAYCVQGRSEEALDAANRAVTLARSLGHPDSLCFALIHAATTQRMLRDATAVTALASEALSLATRHRLLLWQGAGAMLLGWVQTLSGNKEGIAALIASATAARSIMPGTIVAFLHPLAEAYGFIGDPVAQLATVEEALEAAIRVGDYFHRADLYRLKSKSLLRLGRPNEAEIALHTAQSFATSAYDDQSVLS